MSSKTATIFFNNTETQRGGLMHVDGVTVVKMDDLRVGRVPDSPIGKIGVNQELAIFDTKPRFRPTKH